MPLSSRQLKALRETPVGQFGNRIAEATAIAEISQADLSRAVGKPQQYVNDVARGRIRNISIENAHQFAEFFGCQIEDLFPREAMAS
jgi:transcriptional regulator with XRE-family HTH domain